MRRLRAHLQAEKFAQESSEMGVRQRAPIPVPLLHIQGQAKDAHGPTHGEDAQGNRLFQCDKERDEKRGRRGRLQRVFRRFAGLFDDDQCHHGNEG